MAVLAYKRQDNKLEILNIAMTVFEESVKMIKQNDLLSKKNYRIIGEPFLSNIRQMMYCITLANNVFVKDSKSVKKRIELQLEARKYLVMLQVDIQLMMKLTSDQKTLMSGGKLLKLVDDLKAKDAGWIKYTLQDYMQKHSKQDDLNPLP